jgi:hypothetical protein
MTIDQLIDTTFHTADAQSRLAAADAQFAAEFVALKGEAQAARWRGLDHGAKFRLVVRRIEALGKTWMPSIVEEFIAKYDAQFAAGPVDAAVEGALERLAFDNAQHAETADKADRAHFRRAATAYTNALIEYRNGVRPQLLNSGAYLLPSRRAGEAPHIVSMDGDWTCNCKAGASMHWPLALVIGIEVSQDDMERFDDPPCEPTPAELGQRLAAARQRLYSEAA